MEIKSAWIYAGTFFIAAAGFLMPFWPLCLLGILLAALTGRFAFAVFLGLLLDVGWGTPPGILHLLYIPFTLFALLCAAGYALFGKYLFSKSPQETL